MMSEHREDTSSKTIQPLKYSVKETVCLASEKRNVNQCEFKADGDENSQSTQEPNFLIKETVCLVSEKAVTEQCDFEEDGPTCVRRSRFGRFFKKVRKQLGRVLRNSRITLGGRMRF
ncbi:tektin-3 [Platysternon megacephalum]|uniref:Tektin-3 n=1 Tax=Platysternon megacephalum TaxID=55544 RepID=A0A4D9EDG9_9SAUR|nr:tektin-3 [Platysternon megacephalum]